MNYVEELLAEALISAPGCPETVVERIVRTACTAFYRETFAWRITTDPIPVIQGMREVDLDIPANTQPCRVYWARLAGRDLKAVTPRYMKDEQHEPSGYSFTGNQGSFVVDPLPERTYTRDGLVVHLAVAPTNKLDDLPDTLFDAHRDGILYAAQARLLAMPNVSWGNLNESLAMAALGEAEKLKAKREAEAVQAPVTRVVRYGGI